MARPVVSTAQDEPWRSFATARSQIEAGDKMAAIETLKSIVLMEDLESRHLLQAWHKGLAAGLRGWFAPSDKSQKTEV